MRTFLPPDSATINKRKEQLRAGMSAGMVIREAYEKRLPDFQNDLI
jgi:hypothetical protein